MSEGANVKEKGEGKMGRECDGGERVQEGKVSM